MNDFLKWLPGVFAAAKDAPPAPVLLRAGARWLTDLIIRGAITEGPTANYLAQMSAQGLSIEAARELYNATLTDALGRTTLGI